MYHLYQHGHRLVAAAAAENVLCYIVFFATGLASLGFRTGIRFATVSRLCPIPTKTVGAAIALISHTLFFTRPGPETPQSHDGTIQFLIGGGGGGGHARKENEKDGGTKKKK